MAYVDWTGWERYTDDQISAALKRFAKSKPALLESVESLSLNAWLNYETSRLFAAVLTRAPNLRAIYVHVDSERQQKILWHPTVFTQFMPYWSKTIVAIQTQEGEAYRPLHDPYFKVPTVIPNALSEEERVLLDNRHTYPVFNAAVLRGLTPAEVRAIWTTVGVERHETVDQMLQALIDFRIPKVERSLFVPASEQRWPPGMDEAALRRKWNQRTQTVPCFAFVLESDVQPVVFREEEANLKLYMAKRLRGLDDPLEVDIQLRVLGYSGFSQLRDVCKDASNPYLVTQMVDGVSFMEVNPHAKPIYSPEWQRIWMIRLRQQLEIANDLGVIHNDAHRNNVFANFRTGHITLLDFGESLTINGRTMEEIGERFDLGPEHAYRYEIQKIVQNRLYDDEFPLGLSHLVRHLPCYGFRGIPWIDAARSAPPNTAEYERGVHGDVISPAFLNSHLSDIVIEESHDDMNMRGVNAEERALLTKQGTFPVFDQKTVLGLEEEERMRLYTLVFKKAPAGEWLADLLRFTVQPQTRPLRLPTDDQQWPPSYTEAHLRRDYRNACIADMKHIPRVCTTDPWKDESTPAPALDCKLTRCNLISKPVETFPKAWPELDTQMELLGYSAFSQIRSFCETVNPTPPKVIENKGTRHVIYPQRRYQMTMQVVPGFELFALFAFGPIFSAEWQRIWSIRLRQALEILHELGWIHMDLYFGNIFMTFESGGALTLIDFDVSYRNRPTNLYQRPPEPFTRSHSLVVEFFNLLVHQQWTDMFPRGVPDLLRTVHSELKLPFTHAAINSKTPTEIEQFKLKQEQQQTAAREVSGDLPVRDSPQVLSPYDFLLRTEVATSGLAEWLGLRPGTTVRFEQKGQSTSVTDGDRVALHTVRGATITVESEWFTRSPDNVTTFVTDNSGQQLVAWLIPGTYNVADQQPITRTGTYIVRLYPFHVSSPTQGKTPEELKQIKKDDVIHAAHYWRQLYGRSVDHEAFSIEKAAKLTQFELARPLTTLSFSVVDT